MLKIGEFSKLSGISVRMLRHYDEIGLLHPAETAPPSADTGYAFDGNAFLIYQVSPHETQNPDEFVTEICYPVKKLMN